MHKRALITGISGQDASYLAELLLEKNIEVFGMIRRCSTPNLGRISHLLDKITLLYGDMTDPVSLDYVVKNTQPDLVFNLAAQSFVGESWRQPLLTLDVIAKGTLALLESVKNYAPNARFYQASSSEMFGSAPPPQDELTRFHPRSPYGVAKVAAHWAAINYRESYDMFVSCGILFNHESKRRGIEFVTRKITHGVAQIVKGKTTELRLGNLDAKRDWGHSKDYMRAAIMMLEHDKPDDFVIGTGVAHTVQDLVVAAFSHVGLSWSDHVVIDERYVRPAEVTHLLANPQKARQVLGWRPEVTFEELVQEMLVYDLAH